MGPTRGKSGTAIQPEPAIKNLKTYKDLRGANVVQSLYWLYLRGYMLRSHQLQIIQKKMYGPIWKFNMANVTEVNLASPELIESIFRQGEKYPMRFNSNVASVHRDLRKLTCGLLNSEGEQWQKLRTALNKKLLMSQEVERYTSSVSKTVSDLISLIKATREESVDNVSVDNVGDLLYRFTLESLAIVLFENGVGALEKDASPEHQKLIYYIGYALKYLQYLEFLPKWTWYILPYWRRYVEGTDFIFAYVKKMMDRKMEEIQKQLESGKKIEGGFLTFLLSKENMTYDEAYGSITEVLQGGVDTTSNTLSWTLYHLAKDREVQNDLYQEIIGEVPSGQIPTMEDVSRMPLLKAVIKETLRLYPVVPTNGRVALEKDIVVGEYFFPKNTQFTLCHFATARDETNFPEPDTFLPHRWLRDSIIKPHPFSSLPFGFGVRACVGRRIADVQMYLTLSRIIQTFEVIPAPGLGELKAIDNQILIPDKDVNLQFLDREKN